jgi:hypothetical protein
MSVTQANLLIRVEDNRHVHVEVVPKWRGDGTDTVAQRLAARAIALMTGEPYVTSRETEINFELEEEDDD